jgi:hypothetical protein
MKKYLSIFLLLCLICVFAAGCSNESSALIGDNTPWSQENLAGVVDVDGEGTDPQGNSTKSDRIDVDLTVLSSTMIYAEVSNIMSMPEAYIGKTIKVNGLYSPTYYDETGLYYHYVIIADVAACCQQGIEFIWNGDHVYPDDYPDEFTSIEIVGLFGSYQELDSTYYYLAVDDISVL